MCNHQCSGDCRRSGCNCECGEFHCPVGEVCRYDYDECPNHDPKDREFSQEQIAQISVFEEKCAKAGCEDTHKCFED